MLADNMAGAPPYQVRVNAAGDVLIRQATTEHDCQEARKATAIENLQRSAAEVVSVTGTDFNRCRIHALLDLIYDFLVKGKSPGGNHQSHWDVSIETFAGALQDVIDLEITTDRIRPILEQVRNDGLEIFTGSVIGLFSFASYEKKKRFMSSFFDSSLVKELEKGLAYSQWFDQAIKVPKEMVASDGTLFNAEERFAASEIIRILLKNIKVEVWLDFKDLELFLKEDASSKELGNVRITIEFPVFERNKLGLEQQSVAEEVEVNIQRIVKEQIAKHEVIDDEIKEEEELKSRVTYLEGLVERKEECIAEQRAEINLYAGELEAIGVAVNNSRSKHRRERLEYMSKFCMTLTEKSKEVVTLLEKSKVHPAKAAKLFEDIEGTSEKLQRTNEEFSVMYLGLEKTHDITTMAEDCCDLENELSVSTEQESSHEFTVLSSESALE